MSALHHIRDAFSIFGIVTLIVLLAVIFRTMFAPEDPGNDCEG